MRIIQDKVHKTMYYVGWPDGSRSDDFYSKTRAKYYCGVFGAKDKVEDSTLDRPADAIRSPLVRLNSYSATIVAV